MWLNQLVGHEDLYPKTIQSPLKETGFFAIIPCVLLH